MFGERDVFRLERINEFEIYPPTAEFKESRDGGIYSVKTANR